MAYSWWLVKIGDYIIDSKRFIKAESYSAYVNMQDVVTSAFQLYVIAFFIVF